MKGIRFVGENVLRRPQFVDCNAEFIAVTESVDCFARISVLSFEAGCLAYRFSDYGCGLTQLRKPRGLRLVGCSPTTRLVVADAANDRLSVFELNGTFLQTLADKTQGLAGPFDLLETDGGAFLVANSYGRKLVLVSPDCGVACLYKRKTSDDHDVDDHDVDDHDVDGDGDGGDGDGDSDGDGDGDGDGEGEGEGHYGDEYGDGDYDRFGEHGVDWHFGLFGSLTLAATPDGALVARYPRIVHVLRNVELRGSWIMMTCVSSLNAAAKPATAM